MSKRETLTLEVDEIETTSGTVASDENTDRPLVVTASFVSRWDSAPDLGEFLVVEDLEVEHEGRVLDLTPDEYDSFVEFVMSRFDQRISA